MSTNTITQQGSYTADGLNKSIPLRSSVDWMEVINYTNAKGTTADQGYRYTWRRGMATARGLVEFHAAADDTAGMSEIAASHGFTLYDSTERSYGASTALTAVSNAAPPVVAAVSTTLTANSSIVRLYDITGGQQLGGLDWSVGALADGTHFALAHCPIPVAATDGTWRLVAPSTMFYPTTRHITGITAANPAVMVTSVTHDYKVGQMLRMTVPAAFGMVEMDGLIGTVTAVTKTGATGANLITVDIDSSGFTAFAYPVTADAPFTSAMITPVGMNTAYAIANDIDQLADATVNDATIGMLLSAGAAAGVLAPAGANGDEIYWTAGKSFSNLAE